MTFLDIIEIISNQYKNILDNISKFLQISKFIFQINYSFKLIHSSLAFVIYFTLNAKFDPFLIKNPFNSI